MGAHHIFSFCSTIRFSLGVLRYRQISSATQSNPDIDAGKVILLVPAEPHIRGHELELRVRFANGEK